MAVQKCSCCVFPLTYTFPSSLANLSEIIKAIIGEPTRAKPPRFLVDSRDLVTSIYACQKPSSRGDYRNAYFSKDVTM